MNIEETQRRLLSYKHRVYQMRLFPHACDPTTLEWYEMQIDELQAEILVNELMCEVQAKSAPPQLHKLRTDCGVTVWELCRKSDVRTLKIRWDWLLFRPMFYVEFYMV
jgi:hypothetical protein